MSHVQLWGEGRIPKRTLVPPPLSQKHCRTLLSSRQFMSCQPRASDGSHAKQQKGTMKGELLPGPAAGACVCWALGGISPRPGVPGLPWLSRLVFPVIGGRGPRDGAASSDRASSSKAKGRTRVSRLTVSRQEKDSAPTLAACPGGESGISTHSQACSFSLFLWSRDSNSGPRFRWRIYAAELYP